MNPSSVSSLRRLASVARIAAVAQTLPSLLVAAVLTLPAVQSASGQATGTTEEEAQIPGHINTFFKPLNPMSTVYTTLFVDEGGLNTVFLGGDFGYEAILQPNSIPKGNFVRPTFGNANRIIFTAVPERTNINGGSDRKLLLGGSFGRPSSVAPAQNITRIALSGAVDASFAVGAGANGFVTSILPHTDGTIVVGGQFTAFSGQQRLRIVRLLNTGGIDASFNASSQIDNDVLALAEGINPGAVDANKNPVPDGTTLVAGTFNHVGGLSVTKLARLNANGSVDPTFRPVIDARVLAIAVQPTGKIIIGGEFTNINGKPVSRIARLNYDGSLDTTFGAAVSGLPIGESNPVAVYVLKQLKPVLAPDGSLSGGKIYVGGNFTQIDGATRRYLGLINPNGTVGAFDPGLTIYDKVQSVFVQPNGRVLVGETLGPKIGNTFMTSVIRLYGATFTN